MHDTSCSANPTLELPLVLNVGLRLQAYLYDSSQVSNIFASAQLGNLMKYAAPSP